MYREHVHANPGSSKGQTPPPTGKSKSTTASGSTPFEDLSRTFNVGSSSKPLSRQHGGSSTSIYRQLDFYILFCINKRSQIQHTQIQTRKHINNDADFMTTLRSEYRRLRGLARYYLSPFIFSHCSFVKYTRFYVNELAHIGPSLPTDSSYVYSPRPPGPHDDPPISPHEFHRRFYSNHCNPCGRGEALDRIPKRLKPFQVNLHINGREDMWGLQVELRPSFLRILIWQIVITAGGWVFMAWWLSRGKADLQSAAVPITIILSALIALWVPLSEAMK
ncbi:MAG: hypothetical protein Q9164_006397 [Protoblastenia rupestris]